MVPYTITKMGEKKLEKGGVGTVKTLGSFLKHLVVLLLVFPLVAWHTPVFAPTSVHAGASGRTRVVFITSGASSWTISADFSAPWSIEVIGGGAGSQNAQGRGGGGGGAYAKITDADRSLSAGGVLYYSVGAGGALQVAGGDTWANGTANSAPTLVSEGALAKGGGTNSTITGGTGGTSGAASIGTTKYAGGNGGLGNASDGSGGGGGAAGPSGNAQAGGSAETFDGFEGGGGGGSNGGGASVGGNSIGAAGGAGGNGTGGTGGGSGATALAAAGAGTVGGGGGGGFTNTYVGAAGGISTVWTSSTGVVAGSGGGGGGGGDSSSATGGAGALYGGGGGGDGTSGASGILVITYTSTGIDLRLSATVTGNASAISALSKGSGSFVIDHPLDPKNKLLYHSFFESPDAKNIYDGTALLDRDGEVVIELPAYFLALNKDFRYLASPLGESMPRLHLKREVYRKRFLWLIPYGPPLFTLAGGEPKGEVSWQVTGIRHDPFILARPIIPEVEKGPDQIADKGEYICPECYE